MSKNIHTVILDIEGTTTSISFVHTELFPYIRNHLREYLNEHYGKSQELKNDILALYQLYLQDKALATSSGNDALDKFDIPEVLNPSSLEISSDKIIESVIRNVEYQMNKDRKSTALKQLQGHMWKEGYEKELIKGMVYQEIPKCFENWKLNNIDIYIYSSGSIAAQKLLFGYSNFGSLLPYIKGHFDTTIGSKLESSSYENIINSIIASSPSSPSDKSGYLFVTDSIIEAKAARDAGLSTCLSMRSENPEITDKQLLSTFDQVTSFDKLFNNDKFNFKN